MGWFITFEGGEGSGKTTQLRLLAARLEADGHRVVTTREPGGCPIADQVRGVLLDAANRDMTPMAELLLYAAARAQHVAEVIEPGLAAGAVVLCDRFSDATMAYQGYGRRLDRTVIADLNRLATAGRTPDLTILLDCPEEVGLGRAMARIDGTAGPREERFELEALDFHRRVRTGYHELAAREPERFIVIDGARDKDRVSGDVVNAVMAWLRGSTGCPSPA